MTKNHLPMSQNERDDQGMRVIKIFSIRNILIATSFRSVHHQFPSTSNRIGEKIKKLSVEWLKTIPCSFQTLNECQMIRYGTIKNGKIEKKNQGHLSFIKNFFIPPSFQSFNHHPRMKKSHSSVISFIPRSLKDERKVTPRSFPCRLTIKWKKACNNCL